MPKPDFNLFLTEQEFLSDVSVVKVYTEDQTDQIVLGTMVPVPGHPDLFDFHASHGSASTHNASQPDGFQFLREQWERAEAAEAVDRR